MSRIKEKLETIHLYYNVARGIGHTELMMKGLAHFKQRNGRKPLVVCRDSANAVSVWPALKKQPVRTIGLNDLNQLRGTNAPIAFDNYAIHQLVLDALAEIDRLEKELAKKDRKLDQIKTILDWS